MILHQTLADFVHRVNGLEVYKAKYLIVVEKYLRDQHFLTKREKRSESYIPGLYYSQLKSRESANVTPLSPFAVYLMR